MAPWSQYAITIPVAGSSHQSDGWSFTHVSHVVHMRGARRILEDARLRASLVEGKSQLNSTRTRVNWMSANHWSEGSIYGNVQFKYDWQKLVKGRQFYWVEVETSYANPAYRILVTDRPASAFPQLLPYDPQTDNGPLRLGNGTWYWNGQKLASEFMVDDDLQLSDCVELDFVSHRENSCYLPGGTCSDMKVNNHRAAGEIIAYILGNNIHTLDHAIHVPSIFDVSRPLSSSFDIGISNFYFAVTAGKSLNGFISGVPESSAILRGALALFGSGQRAKAKDLVQMLASATLLEDTIAAIVDQHFKISGWRLES